ncbi:7169_t:CDS:2 [Funneliformis mosseae]|uniref:7169_t:CDS:1 n=1 Tax=Funneliformis mosseae TaxID=27381 RepID=A0A9N9CKF2_FUNMO|nr:7169_t:CDS:2 [Funneliformis mosseae]
MIAEISAVDESDSVIDQQNDVNTKSIEEVPEVIAEQSVSDKVIDDFILEESVNVPDSVIAKPPPIHEVYSQLNLSEVQDLGLCNQNGLTLTSQIEEKNLDSESFIADISVEKGLICELLEFIRSHKSLPNSTASSKQIPVDSDLALGSIPHLAHLFDKAEKTGQKEKLRKKRDNLRKMTQKAKNIYTLFKEVGIDKIGLVIYSVNAIGSLTGAQIQNIINLYITECQKVISVKNSSHLRDLPAESSEVSILTSPILLSHVSNSPDNSSGIDSKNSLASQSDQLIPLQKKLPKWKRNKVIDLVINRFKRTTSCLDLHASIDRECLNQVDCYLIHDIEGSKKYYLICDNIQEPGILLNEVLTLYSEKTSPDNWNHLLKVPNREVTVKA